DDWLYHGQPVLPKTSRMKLHLLLDVARALEYLHARDIAHSNLTAKNCLIASDFRCVLITTARNLVELDCHFHPFICCTTGSNWQILPLPQSRMLRVQCNTGTTTSPIWPQRSSFTTLDITRRLVTCTHLQLWR